jgi:hypothetical protein
MLWLAFIVAVWYALKDRDYVKAGGLRTGSSEKWLWLTVSALIVLVAIPFFLVATPDEFWDLWPGFLTLVAMVAFIFYQIKRYRIREKHPLPAPLKIGDE